MKWNKTKLWTKWKMKRNEDNENEMKVKNETNQSEI